MTFLADDLQPTQRLSLAFAALLVSLLAIPMATAQINGVPASVTSIGFGGNNSLTPGVPASVTSLGPNGFGHGRLFPGCCVNRSFPGKTSAPVFFRHHHPDRIFPIAFPYYAAYTPVIIVEQPVMANEAMDNYAEDDDSAGPTIFDRRGSGVVRKAKEKPALSDEEPAPATAEAKPIEPLPVADQPQTVLVFKDGHRSEVRNYAIVGDTLYDFTSGRKKIALSDLDLPKTVQENDDRGTDFKVPTHSAK